MKTYIPILAIILLLPVTLIAQSTQDARKQMEKFNYTLAVEILKKAVAAEDTRNEAIPMLAECYRLQRDIFKARDAYAIAVTLPEAQPEWFFYYAQALQSTGDYIKAREMFRIYSGKVPSDSRGQQYMAYCDSVLGPWSRNRVQSDTNSSNVPVNTYGIAAEVPVNRSTEDYDSLNPNLMAKRSFARNIPVNKTAGQQTPSPQFEVKIVGNINTNASDFGAAFNSGGFVFTSDFAEPNERNLYGWTGRGYLDIMQAFPKVRSDFWGDFSKPVKFNKKINQKYHDGPATFSFDGSSIYFTRSFYGKASKVDGTKTNMLKIFYATKIDSTWGNAEPFFLNSTDHSVGHPSLSSDGNTMYFVSDMAGGEGGTDIYTCNRIGDNWGPPSKLGSVINTKENEMFPTIYADSILYFASSGHPGYGGLDIFESKKQNGKWTNPVNLQPPINSPFDDFAFAFAPGSKSGFFSSDRPNGVGSDDIYAFRLVETPKMLPTYISGLVKDKTTMQPLAGATVFLYNPSTGFVRVLKSGEGGVYTAPVEETSEYLVKAMKTNYIADCTPFTIASLQPGNTILAPRDLLLDKLVINKTFILDNIYYDFDKYNIREDAKPELDKLVRIMKENAISIELGSHTDSRGSFAYNDRLSQKRAESAVNYIVANNIDKSRITAKGYGEYQLVNKCSDGIACTKAEHQANRRTEFKSTSIAIDDSMAEYKLEEYVEGDQIFADSLGAEFFNNCSIAIKALKQSTIAASIVVKDSANKTNYQPSAGLLEVYKVQLFAFNSKKSLNDAAFKSVAGIQLYIDNGKYKYTSGNFANYNQCAEYNSKMIQLGFSESIIVLFKNGKLIEIPKSGK
jgi:outer membrane protein OmpA-like peptidoglycan-associated protein